MAGHAAQPTDAHEVDGGSAFHLHASRIVGFQRRVSLAGYVTGQHPSSEGAGGHSARRRV